MASVLLLPMSFPVIAAAWVRRSVYATHDGRALVVVKLRSAWREIGAILLVFAVLGATFIGLCFVLIEVAFTIGSPTLLAVIQVAPVVALVWFVLGSLLILVPALTSGNSVSPIGPETPNGARWAVESLAARAPADGLDAFLLARKALLSFPSGSILVAGARTRTLHNAYVKLGFTQGQKNRVYKQLP
jgi:hypothetical protein